MNDIQKPDFGSFVPTRSPATICQNVFVWAGMSAAEATLYQLSQDNPYEAVECATIMLEFMVQSEGPFAPDYFLNAIIRNYPHYQPHLIEAMELVEMLTGGKQ